MLSLLATSADLRDNQSVAAHLMHGSIEGAFRVTYATHRLSCAEMDAVGYAHMPLEQAERYLPADHADEYHRDDDGMEYLFSLAPRRWTLDSAVTY